MTQTARYSVPLFCFNVFRRRSTCAALLLGMVAAISLRYISTVLPGRST